MLLDEVQDYAIFSLDPQGMVISWNAGAERIKGYRGEQIIGHSFSCFFPPEDIERGRPEEVLRMATASGGRTFLRRSLPARARRRGYQYAYSETIPAL